MENLLFLGVPILKHIRVVLVNRIGGLSLPMKSVARLTDSPDLIIAVYRGRKTITQQQQQQNFTAFSYTATFQWVN